jgi:hypothetical protein
MKDGGGGSSPQSDAGEGGAPSNCPMLAAPTNGTVNAGSLSPGASARFSCSVGYDLVGSDTLVCQTNGQWDKPAPTCKIKDCGPLSQPAQGSVSVPSTTYGSVATYSCPVGYGPVPGATRTCQADGTWSGTAPTCVPAMCPALTAPAGGTVTAQALTYGSVATYACSIGYAMTGTATRTCQQDGTWSGSAPTCTIKNCGTLANPTNGTVSAPATTYGSTATYSCAAGYNMSGSATRTCQDTATWSGTAPTCVIVNCGALTNPANGAVNAPTTTYGSSATYSCTNGYGLVGPTTRSCQANGTWSGATPMCLSQANCDLKVLSDTIALWPFDDGMGQAVRDIGPHAFNGTLGPTNAVDMTDPTWSTPGRFAARGLTTNGASQQYVHVGTGIAFPNNALTFESWVRPTTSDYAQYFTAGFINLYVSINWNADGIDWGIGDGMNWQLHSVTGAPVALNTWHYVAVTYDGATMTAYLDGASIGTKSATTTLAVPMDYELGGRPSNTFLTGVLGPMRLSSTAHTAATIAQQWTNSLACPAPP